jgi:holin-like protein
VRLLIGIAWLWAFLGLGSAAVDALGLPLPGSVAGMLLLWAALEARLVRLDWLERGATSLLGVLGLLFVPAGVGLAQYAGAGLVWLAAIAIVLVGALVTLAVTGHVTQRRLTVPAAGERVRGRG